MSATDELRRLLDERGVEWNKGKLAMLDDEYTHWWATERMVGFVAYECDYPLNTLIVRGVTPEQAIDATLGRGTCHDVSENPLRYECSECGAVSLEIAPRFCPACGREVVTDG